jgi:hypothetical protein
LDKENSHYKSPPQLRRARSNNSNRFHTLLLNPHLLLLLFFHIMLFFSYAILFLWFLIIWIKEDFDFTAGLMLQCVRNGLIGWRQSWTQIGQECEGHSVFAAQRCDFFALLISG